MSKELTNPFVDEMVQSIQTRETTITSKKGELLSLWITQGKELLELKAEQEALGNGGRQGFTVAQMVKLSGLSRDKIASYIEISTLQNRVSDASETPQLENFNQKELVKLTKLDDEYFTKSVEAGKLIAPPKEPKEEEFTEADIEEEFTEEKTYTKDEVMGLIMEVTDGEEVTVGDLTFTIVIEEKTELAELKKELAEIKKDREMDFEDALTIVRPISHEAYEELKRVGLNTPITQAERDAVTQLVTGEKVKPLKLTPSEIKRLKAMKPTNRIALVGLANSTITNAMRGVKSSDTTIKKIKGVLNG